MGSPLDHAGADTDWEARYRAGDTPWEKGGPHPALVAFLAKRPLSGRVLVPGCGSGHDVRAIALAGAEEVIGLDIAPSAIATAAARPPAGGERYVLGDFLGGGAPGVFDALFEHTCFCAINPAWRKQYAAAAAAVLKPGGLLAAIFYMDPDHDAGPPFGCTLEELDDLFRDTFQFEDIFQGIATFAGREHRERFCLLRRK